ncbi:DNA polymerase III subunit beta [Desulfuribacillus stibiiarsenatis]|uniref:Beta sliding clamp n=1 Tax=Desulfuribacillus stibiiarsenatis TaxID=1390249 RepID=A0A1E5L8K7_9FIRM|nr:DNA polymerase III subunit beta [Desulfuribacillus stibiiarsenatis]OEH86475.1 DNA polymerase III subunit beta [Desulfuribacillus stibiiarsenatis]
MKFSIVRESLIQAVQDVVKAVASKSTIPILENLKLQVTNDYIRITGTNLEIGVEYTIPKEKNQVQNFTVEQEGSICLKAKYFNEIIRKLSHDLLEIEVSNQFLITIKSGQSEFSLHGLDSEEFPKLPTIIEDRVFSVPSDLLKSMIRQTVFAVANEETRPVLTGVKWSLESGVLTFIATDSHRLAMREAVVEADSEYSFQNIIVPGKSLLELSKILEDSDTLVEIVIANNQLLMKMDNILFYSRLIDGQYPDVTRIIQQQAKTTLDINKREMLDSLERVSLVARENKNNEVKFNIKQDLIMISSNSPDIGKVNESIQPNHVEGEELLIAFNTKYVLDSLRIIDEENILVQFTGSMSPFIIKPKDFDKYLYLVLPIRIY